MIYFFQKSKVKSLCEKWLGLEAEAVGRGRRVMDNIDHIGFLLIVLCLFVVMLTNLNFDKFLTSFLFFCFYDRMSDFCMNFEFDFKFSNQLQETAWQGLTILLKFIYKL